MTRVLLGVSAGASVACAASGAEYSWRVAGGYGQDDAANIVESSRWALDATYYPRAVDESTGPYDLAPFHSRSSSVTVGWSRAEEETALRGYYFGPRPFIERFLELYRRSTAETAKSFVSGRYVRPDSGWYFGGGAERARTDERPSRRDVKSRAVRIDVGRYLGEATTLDVTLGTNRDRQKPDERECEAASWWCHGLVGRDTDTEEAAVSVHHVGELWRRTYSVRAGVSSSRSDYRLVPPRLLDPEGRPIPEVSWTGNEFPGYGQEYSYKTRVYFLSGEWFPTRALGVRLGYVAVDQTELGETAGLGLRAKWFFRGNLAAEAAFTRTRLKGSIGAGNRDSDSVSIKLQGRF